MSEQTFINFEEVRERFNKDNNQKRFKLLSFAGIGFEKNQPYVVKGVFSKPSLSVIWGRPKCGKTFWCLDLAMHIALGETFHGKKVTQGHVVYCALEGKSGISKRIEAYRQYKLNNRTPDFSLMRTPLQMIADHETLIADIHSQVGEKNPAAIFIDTLNRSIDGSENEDKIMTAYLNAASAIMEAFECAVRKTPTPESASQKSNSPRTKPAAWNSHSNCAQLNWA
jgi:RecA-family ATPase